MYESIYYCECPYCKTQAERWYPMYKTEKEREEGNSAKGSLEWHEHAKYAPDGMEWVSDGNRFWGKYVKIEKPVGWEMP